MHKIVIIIAIYNGFNLGINIPIYISIILLMFFKILYICALNISTK